MSEIHDMQEVTIDDRLDAFKDFYNELANDMPKVSYNEETYPGDDDNITIDIVNGLPMASYTDDPDHGDVGELVKRFFNGDFDS